MPNIPDEPPPSYEQATSSEPESSLRRSERNGIPLRARRSMEDELRPLPEGWVRTFDPATHHQFFVDTKADPPRSIWHHPYDDEQFLQTLPPTERDRVRASARIPNKADVAAESTDEDAYHSDGNASQPRRRLGRKFKDKITGTTHEQRAAERRRREAQEQEAYQQHVAFRKGMIEATRTGRPQYIGKDKNGQDLYLEPAGRGFPGVDNIHRLSPYLSEVSYGPSRRPGPPGRYLRPEFDMYGMGAGYGAGNWNRPNMAYRRPVGMGYGGGMGFPLFAPLMGGVLLGSLAGSMF
ncbi:hypothetical protein QBC34DRAFT_448282 [Podospora aff. communis PSN243]|uniref:WW domain-containing protein n=1 Tax=Podospora aff. communis PSN243 TaxID=3040156 RepID=A0AAV9GRD5_9PEZI|nr:hypothetical protein QBC34DRAFT_448282 [Podospora aff. communis PSN243]